MPKEKKVKKTPEVEPFFKEMVGVWFQFCLDKFLDKPTFDGSAPRDLKAIIKTLRERSLSKEIEWTLETAQQRFSRFLHFAYKDNWLQKNWLLFNINRQKDKIFFSIQKSISQSPVDPFE